MWMVACRGFTPVVYLYCMKVDVALIDRLSNPGKAA